MKNDPEHKGVHYDYILPIGHEPAGHSEQVSSQFTFSMAFRTRKQNGGSLAYPIRLKLSPLSFVFQRTNRQRTCLCPLNGVTKPHNQSMITLQFYQTEAGLFSGSALMNKAIQESIFSGIGENLVISCLCSHVRPIQWFLLFEPTAS